MSVRKAIFSFSSTCLLAAMAWSPADAFDHSPSPAGSPIMEAGTIGGAPYRVDIPSHWNGDLVVLAHGFEPAGASRTSPWPQNEATSVFLSAGYAVAQSGFSLQGWAVREAIEDTERLRQHFIKTHGAARRNYLVGFSMGGGVAVASLEQHSGDYDGALSLCGANVPGPQLMSDLFTTLVAFDYFFPTMPGLPGGLSNPNIASLDQGTVYKAIADAIPSKPEAAALLANRLQVSAEALPGIISLHYLVFQDITQRVGMPIDNRKTTYSGFGDDKAFNAAVPRYAGDAKAMRYLASSPALTGNPGKPLVIQYNHGDPTIAPRFQSIYNGLAEAPTPIPLVLPLAGEGHCGFSPDQIAQAFKVLTGWVESGERPTGE